MFPVTSWDATGLHWSVPSQLTWSMTESSPSCSTLEPSGEEKCCPLPSRQPKRPSSWKEVPVLLFHLGHAPTPFPCHVIKSYSLSTAWLKQQAWPWEAPSPHFSESLMQGLSLPASLLSSHLYCPPSLGTFTQNPSNFNSAIENLFCAWKHRKASQEIRCKILYSQYLLHKS